MERGCMTLRSLRWHSRTYYYHQKMKPLTDVGQDSTNKKRDSTMLSLTKYLYACNISEAISLQQMHGLTLPDCMGIARQTPLLNGTADTHELQKALHNI